jgi:hypothetical protein
MANTLASVRAAAQEVAKRGQLLPHQLAAFSALDQALTPEQRQAFTDDWRAVGSPAAPPPARPANPMAVPYFAQGDNGAEGWRQCQTSALSMCLAYLGLGGIRDDVEYLHIVQRHGDTTDQAAHQKALASLNVKARFVQNCSAAQLQAEIRAGLPAAIGILHHGTPQAATGGGHWITVCGFDTASWIVNDPYGELDLMAGRWLRIGGTSGKGLRYSYKNLNPRWLPEGAASGWAWLFS